MITITDRQMRGDSKRVLSAIKKGADGTLSHSSIKLLQHVSLIFRLSTEQKGYLAGESRIAWRKLSSCEPEIHRKEKVD